MSGDTGPQRTRQDQRNARPEAPAPATETTPEPEEGDLQTDEGQTQRPSTEEEGGDLDPASLDAEPAVITYPTLTLAGQGATQCKEALGTTTRVETSLNDTELRINRQDIRVECFQGDGFLSQFLGIGACNQQEFDAQIKADALGTTRFVRLTKEEARALKAQGVKLGPWGIFAMSAVTHKGATYRFDKPLPIFPWPAALSRYDELDKGPATYAAQATGPRALSVSVVVTKVGVVGDVVKLQFDTTLNASTDHTLYDDFPIPKRAIYHVDTKNKDVRTIESLDWFSDKNCQQNGQVTLNYRLCKKVQDGQTQDVGGC